MEARIGFKDGTEIIAEENGNCFIVAAKPTFPADLSIVTVKSMGKTETLKNVMVQECASVDGRYWFTFIEMSDMDVWKASIEDALCELSMG